MRISTTIKHIVDFYEKYPQFRGKVSVNTPFGFKPILAAEKTDHSVPMMITTESNKICISSKMHRYKIGEDELFEHASKLKEGDRVLTKDGYERIIEIRNFKKKIDLYDLEVADVHQYYTNGIVSHNSVLWVDALFFALFGKTLKNTNNKYIPNRCMPESLKPYVKVYLRSNGQMYSCETFGRVVSKTMSTVGMELLKLDDDFNVIENITQSSIAKTKQYIIDNILGCSFDVFKSSIAMTSADFMNFYEGMGKDQKRKYVETIFNLGCFGEMYSIVKRDLNDLKKDVTTVKTQLISTKQRLDDFKQKSEEHESQKSTQKTALKKRIVQKANEFNDLKKQLDEFVIEDEEELLAKKSDLSKKVSKLQSDKVSLEKAIIKKEGVITQNEKSISQIKKITDVLCDDCAPKIKKMYKYDDYENEIAEAKASIDEANTKLETIAAEAEKAKADISVIEESVAAYTDKKHEKSKLELSMKYIKDDIITLKGQLADLDTANPFIELIEQTKKEFDDLTERLANHVTNVKYLEILKSTSSENGIKKYIMKDIIKLLNSLIQKYLNEIGCEFIVYFDETFDFKFITSTGECEFSNFSAGEKQRIQIATLFAFRDLILNGKINSNIFIIDELLDANVDTACIENVMNILKRKSIESNQNIFMISHRSELADNMSFWNNIIKVTKQNQQSTYEVI